jgi:hypothetical protein
MIRLGFIAFLESLSRFAGEYPVDMNSLTSVVASTPK